MIKWVGGWLVSGWAGGWVDGVGQGPYTSYRHHKMSQYLPSAHKGGWRVAADALNVQGLQWGKDQAPACLLHKGIGG